MGKVELLAPAGNLEKLKIAVIYGADAVYCGGFNYGLRAAADNFSLDDLKEGTEFCHKYNVNIYITVNMIPHNQDLKDLPQYLLHLQDIGVDGLIISDPGVLKIIRENNIKIPLHLSTQANTVNWKSASFWAEQGIERIILARELNQKEIKEINEKTEIELEAFIHGAMCISYSGRCLLSNYLTDRDPNRGKCAHSCRWQYFLMEKERPGEYFPVFEDEKGSYILNSRDLCLIEYIPELIETGINSFKIEGRMKGLHYVATVTGVYRQAIDSFYEAGEKYRFKEEWLNELKKISHRVYTTGFFIDDSRVKKQYHQSSAYRRTYDFMGIIREYDNKNKEAVVEVRNKLKKGDRIEIIGPSAEVFNMKIDYIINEENKKVEKAPHPGELIRIPLKKPVKPYYLIRKEKDQGCDIDERK